MKSELLPLDTTGPRLLLVWLVIVFALTTSSSEIQAQAFVNDNDGLLDVGEASRFPENPGETTGELDLSGRGIKDLDGANLLQSLTLFNLRDNEISNVEAGDFFGLEQLQTLNLGHNHLTSIESREFEGLVNLSHLILNSNRIADIESGGFRELTNLKELNLISNEITRVERGDFLGLEGLEELWLHGNLISQIAADTFTDLPNLRKLGLAGNSFTHVEADFFTSLSGLSELHLSSNSLSDFDSAPFYRLSKLRRLVLQSNAITTIDSNLLQGLAQLRTLHLTHNPISNIETGAFSEANALADLLLTDTELSTLNFAGASFDALGLCSTSFGPGWVGFCVDSEEVSSLVLDDARLSQDAFDAIVTAANSITEASLTRLDFHDAYPADLTKLLEIPSLDNVRVDPNLYALYDSELNSFAALPGNSVTVVPEPTCVLLLSVAMPFLRRISRRCKSRETQVPESVRHVVHDGITSPFPPFVPTAVSIQLASRCLQVQQAFRQVGHHLT